MIKKNSRSLIAFDLDGTLLDTAPDFVFAVNTLEDKYGVERSNYSEIRNRVSDGAIALTKFAFNLKDNSPSLLNLKNELLDIYMDCCLQETKEFEGIKELLRIIESNNTPWGIVTNKPLRYAEKIIKDKLSSFNFNCLICPDHTNSRKPDPKGLILACELTQCIPNLSVYVGDNRVDIDAGNNAGMKTIAVSYGYVKPDDPTVNWGADICVDKVSELLQHIY